jgi:hypothetical protein
VDRDVEGAIYERKLPSVTFFHLNPVVRVLDLRVLQNGLRRLSSNNTVNSLVIVMAETSFLFLGM